ncbi:hypothetical protein EVAR_46461_1 [Eumeta japonica]|uniref:Uncharacterized protein n=1 Tax=Eumeta variegata TaxID=151549 RepID=A0A4C1XI20_EUMVA|nr:hypothetical protein EVAR_46461_1 [Eumeta japonica]
MTAIKEYPFDLSDLKDQQQQAGATDGRQDDAPATLPTESTTQAQTTPRSNTPDGKRKVSIMANENSKDRENITDSLVPQRSISRPCGFFFSRPWSRYLGSGLLAFLR